MKIVHSTDRKNIILLEDMKVFQINECDWVASPTLIEALILYHNEFSLDADFCTPREVNLDTEGMWDFSSIKYSEALINGTFPTASKPPLFGDLYYYEGEVYEFVPFRKALESTPPSVYVIQSIE